MAQRTLISDRGALLKRLSDLYAAVSVGAAGAVTLQLWNYPVFGGGVGARTYTAADVTGGGTSWPSQYQAGIEGVRSVARTAAGLWTITLQDNYQRLVGLTGHARLAGGLSAVAAIHENTTITAMATAGGSIIGVALLDFAGAAVDPASGETVILHFALQDATEP